MPNQWIVRDKKMIFFIWSKLGGKVHYSRASIVFCKPVECRISRVERAKMDLLTDWMNIPLTFERTRWGWFIRQFCERRAISVVVSTKLMHCQSAETTSTYVHTHQTAEKHLDSLSSLTKSPTCWTTSRWKTLWIHSSPTLMELQWQCMLGLKV